MRLGQRLCGGVGSALKGTRLRLDNGNVVLKVERRDTGLVAEVVERRLKRLADSMGRTAVIASS
jgi:hypothetical protein